MRKENLEYKFTELDNVYRKNNEIDASLVIDIKSSNKEPYSLSPTFDPIVKRYCWVPEKKKDHLNLDFTVIEDTKIYVNDVLLESNNLKIYSKDGPKEYNFKFQKNDQIARYSLISLPTNFPP